MIHSLAALALLAPPCPTLAGKYACDLEVRQWAKPPSGAVYSFDFRQVGGEPDVFSASVQGEHDSLGWTIYCRGDRLVSISDEGTYRSELYRTREGHLIRTLNGKIQQDCAPAVRIRY